MERASSLAESVAGVLDDYELVLRSGVDEKQAYVDKNAASLCCALFKAAEALHGRSEMLRIAVTLRGVLWGAPRNVVREAVRGLAARDAEHPDEEPMFAQSILKIAIERVSDSELSACAADSLAILYGTPALEEACINERSREEANRQTISLVNSLITEVALSASPSALVALGALLRRDFSRTTFCRRDGVSTLASTLRTNPEAAHTSIGEAVTALDVQNHPSASDPVTATYHAVFALWMLSYAASTDCATEMLRYCVSSRLVLVFANLLDHVSGRRLKIARVVLATLRNLAVGDSDVHLELRREMVGAGLPAVLRRLVRHDIVSRDTDAADDAKFLFERLSQDESDMSTLDMYLGELRSGTLRWSTIHKDEGFWSVTADRIVLEYREVLPLLADIISGKDTTDENRIVACNDLAMIVRFSVPGRRAALALPGLKSELMALMAGAKDSDLRSQALICVQLLVLSPKRKL